MAVLRLCVLAEGLPAGDDPVARVTAELSADHEVVVALTEGERPDGAFDVALALESLAHFADPARAIADLTGVAVG